jgi:signal transduction histidine kinase/CheY-like chemotaxis protein
MKFVLIILSVLFGYTQSSFSQSPPYWRYWRTEDGLWDAVTQRAKMGEGGKLWITHGAVEKMSIFDGYTFDYIPSPALNVPVYECESGQIWSYFYDEDSSKGGLQQFAGGEWIRYPIDGIHSSADSFYPMGMNRVLCLATSGAVVFDASTNQTTVIKNVKDSSLGRFHNLAPAPDGSVWISCERGLARLNGPDFKTSDSFTWDEYFFDSDLDIEDLRNLVVNENGVVVGRASSGQQKKKNLVSFDGERWKLLHVSDEYINCGWPGMGNSFWFINGTNTLTYVEKDQPVIIDKISSLQGIISTVCLEENGCFFLTTAFGLVRYAPPSWRCPGVPPVLKKNWIHRIFEDKKGRLWLRGPDYLMLYHNNQYKVFASSTNSKINNTVGLCSLPDGRIIFENANDKVLSTFNPDTETFDDISHPKGRHIEFVTHDRDGLIWVETSIGNREKCILETFDGVDFESKHILGQGWDGINLRDLHHAKNGDLWIAGWGGDGVGVFKNGKYLSFGRKDGLPDSVWLSIIELDNGNIWIGGRKSIYEYDGHSWTEIRSRFENVRSMIKSRDGSVWAATQNGLYRYLLENWISIKMDEGLPTDIVYKVYEDSQGDIWVGTTLGVSRYFPGADPDPPETYIPLARNSKIVSPGGESTFNYEGIDKWKYTLKNRLLYSYQFDDRDWSPFGSDTVVSATGLTAGSHRFQVRAMDRNWNVDPTPALFEFTVILPWYKEPFFIVFFIISILLITVSLAYAIHRHIRLHTLVDMRTRDLKVEIDTRKKLEEQLIQASKMEAIGQLAGGVAHDFNNILMAISGNSGFILNHKNLDSSIREDAEEIKKAAARAAALTRQLLAFSRKQILEPKIINLNDLIQEMVKMLERLMSEDVQLNFIPTHNLHSIKIDPGQMEQVIMNLAVNASDSMPQGGSLTIETKNANLDEGYAANHSDVHPGQHVMLVISDTGHGMDKDIQKRIFDPFYTTKERGKGTGMGLSTVYGIVKQCGGNIWVYSEIGKGTTFKIYFPSVDQPEPSTFQDAKKEESKNHGNETILIVEDDEMVRKLSSRALKDFGYTVLEARNGLKALQICEDYQEHIDLVLTDVIMPQMNGPELAKQLSVRFPKIKVIYMSGYTDNAIAHHGILEEGIAFLNKPASPDELVKKVRDVLDSREC